MTYFIIIISAIIVNNVVLAQFLGICPFLGTSKRFSTAVGMSSAVIFVIVLSTIFTWFVQKFLLEPFNITYLQTIAFILVIASLVQIVEIVLKKVSPPLYQALGIFLPLISTNCAILGVAIMTANKGYNLLEGVIFSASTGIGFGLALVIFACIREQLDLVDIPNEMKGAPIALITTGILAMAFMGFTGLV